MKHIALFASLAALVSLMLLGSSATTAHTSPTGFQRLRLPWSSDYPRVVTQSDQSSPTHKVGSADEYAVDFNVSYYTFFGATGQGTLVSISRDYSSEMDLGAYVYQAVTIPGDSPSTKYVVYAHMCYIPDTFVAGSTYLYQGQYVGRSGNSGYVLHQGQTVTGRCATNSDGSHAHFLLANGYPRSTANVYQFGSEVESLVSGHRAANSGTDGLPTSHVAVPTNNAGAGFYAFTGAAGGSPTVDSWIAAKYNASAFGLNYGTTDILGSSYRPCANSNTRWVHGCTWGSHSGIVQTFTGPGGSATPKALTRETSFTSVFSVEGPVLYAWRLNASVIGYATGNRSGTTQQFRAGRVEVTASPCQTKVWSNSLGQYIATYSGIC